MFDAHCHFQTENAIVYSAQLLPQYINYPFDMSLAGFSEIGLDKRYEFRVSMEKQIRTLVSIMEHAKKNGIPVSLHCVGATGAMIDILQEVRPERGYCMWHGFTRSAEVAKRLERLEVMVSVGPRFKGNIADLKYFVIETDYEGTSAAEHDAIIEGLYRKYSQELGMGMKELEVLCSARATAFKNYRLAGQRQD